MKYDGDKCLTGKLLSQIAAALGRAEDAGQAASQLNAKIVEDGYHLNTGFLSTPFLCGVLCDYGYEDTAYRLLLQEEVPGVLIDDDGSVYLFTGFSPAPGFLKTVMGLRGLKIDGGYYIVLEQDMITMKSDPKMVIPGPDLQKKVTEQCNQIIMSLLRFGRQGSMACFRIGTRGNLSKKEVTVTDFNDHGQVKSHRSKKD